MRVVSILFGFLVFAGIGPSFSEVKFKDVPSDHWAAKAVYGLVRLGITSGYPDGTFRGQKTITRFETAIFLSKLAEKIGSGDAAKIKEDLKKLKDDIAALKKSGGPVAVHGLLTTRSMLTNILAAKGISGKGPIINYRLITGLEKNVGENASVKVNLDTMDSGFYGATRDLAREMLDIEGVIKMNPADLGIAGDVLSAPVELKFTSGPGVTQHFDASGLASSENGIAYIRPDTGVVVSSKIGEVALSASYLVGSYDLSYSGKVDTNYGAVSAQYEFNKFPVLNNLSAGICAGFYAKRPNTGGPRDQKIALDLRSEINPKLSTSLNLTVSKPDTGTWMAGVGVKLTNVVEGARLNLKLTKIGSAFVPAELKAEEIGETGYDVFSRPLENATMNLDYDLVQTVNDKLKLKSLGTLRLSSDLGFGPDRPMSLYTVQFGFSYQPSSDSELEVFYRAHKDVPVEETTDLIAAGALFKF